MGEVSALDVPHRQRWTVSTRDCVVNLGNGELLRPSAAIGLDERKCEVVATLVLVALSHVGLEARVPDTLEICATQLPPFCSMNRPEHHHGHRGQSARNKRG